MFGWLFAALLSNPNPPWGAIFDQGDAITFGAQIEGPSPYTRNTDKFFKPASTSKLFTTLAVLERFGPEAQFETRLQWAPVAGSEDTVTDLALLGSGDPSWGLEEVGETYLTRIDQIAQALHARGIKQVIGPVRVDAMDCRFAHPRVPEGWLQSDRDECYGVLGQAFNLQINCATYEVQSPTSGRFQERGVPVNVHFDIHTGSATFLIAHRDPTGFTITGTWGSRSGPQIIYLPVDDVTEWVRRLFIAALAEKGIQVSESEIPPASDSRVESLSFYSPKLSEILKPFLKMSINPIGDSFMRILGASAYPQEPDLVNAGLAALGDFTARLGISQEALLKDGSGLSQDTRVTTGALMKLLEDAKNRSDFPVLWESLPIAGVDGTLRKRMRDSAAEGVLRAKTGTLTGAYNLAGYVPRFDRAKNISEFIPFVILSDTSGDKKVLAHEIEDEIGVNLVNEIDPILK